MKTKDEECDTVAEFETYIGDLTIGTEQGTCDTCGFTA